MTQKILSGTSSKGVDRGATLVLLPRMVERGTLQDAGRVLRLSGREALLEKNTEKPRLPEIAILPQPEFKRSTLKDPRRKEIKEDQPLEWWRNMVTYQIMTRSFYDTDGDGEGDLKGIIEKADYIKEMGFKAIWLNPIHKSPHKDNGYDISNYMGIDPKYGNLDDLKHLIDEMKKRDIKVLLDLVINHTSDEHPWFKRSRESKDNMMRDVYIWKPGKKTEDGKTEPPNNWIACFGDPAWTYDEKTGEYYFHKFAIGQPDLNLRNPSMREHMKKVLEQWLKMGVAGVRMDTADIYFEDPAFSDAKPNPDYKPGVDSLNRKFLQHDKFHIEDESNAYLKEIMGVLDKYDGVGIGEIDSEDLPHVSRLYTEARMHIPFNFNLLHVVSRHGANAELLKKRMDEYMGALPEGSCASIVFDNHDQYKRLSEKVGKNLRALTLMELSFGGEGGCMQAVHYGDEMGMPSGPVTEATMDDVFGKNQGLNFCRDFSRTPMQWDTSKNAGFSKNPDAKPWLPVGDPAGGNNVEEQMKDKNSMLNLTKNLIKLRHEQPALVKGRYVPYRTEDNDLIIFGREAKEQECLVLCNFSGEEKMMKLPEGKMMGEVMISTDAGRTLELVDGKITLGPNEGCIVKII